MHLFHHHQNHQDLQLLFRLDIHHQIHHQLMLLLKKLKHFHYYLVVHPNFHLHHHQPLLNKLVLIV
ncbi:MAG: hypothetical protein CMJ17_14300 [Phenylobacterium sp.]|nr:hypothetical protein [Phenylobacterium sp.]